MISQVDNVAPRVLVLTNCRCKYVDAIAMMEFNSVKATTFFGYVIYPQAFIAKTPLQSRVRLDTQTMVMCTTSQCKLRSPFRNVRVRNRIGIVKWDLPDVVHITTVWVSRLVLDHAIAAIQTSR